MGHPVYYEYFIDLDILLDITVGGPGAVLVQLSWWVADINCVITMTGCYTRLQQKISLLSLNPAWPEQKL